MFARTALKDPCETAIAMLNARAGTSRATWCFGTAAIPGFFKGQTAAVKAAAEYCLAQRRLEETGGEAAQREGQVSCIA